MKSNRILVLITGILLFLSIAFTFSWLLSPTDLTKGKGLSLEEIKNKIKIGEVKEIAFKRQQLVELTDIKGGKLYTNIKDNEVRDALFEEVMLFNNTNPRSFIKLSEEATSSGWKLNDLVSNLPFYMMWGITLLVIVYAVRTLSRNKG